MDNVEKIIYPMMIELKERIEDSIYYVSLPKRVKEKWIELEYKSRSSYNPAYNLPTVTLKAMFNTYLDGVIDMNPVSNSTDDSRWLVSFKKVNISIVLNCFKIWIEEFYIKGGMTKDKKRKDGNDAEVNRLANEFKALLISENFGELRSEEIVLFEDGRAASKEGYQLYPLKIVNSLMGKTILIAGKKTKLLYSSRNELVTDPHMFKNGMDYYSFLIRLNVQTLPPENKAYLNVDVSVRRWISRNEKGEGDIFLPNDKNCYIRVKEDRLQSIRTQYNRDLKENVWKTIDYSCFKECQIQCTVPRFTEVLKKPETFNNGKVGDVLIPYEEGIPYINTSVKSGVTFMDRKTAFEYIRNQVFVLDNITSEVEAANLKKVVRNSKNTFSLKDSYANIRSKHFLSQLHKVLDGEKLTVEIYADSPVKEAIARRIGEYLGIDSKHEIKYCDSKNLFKELDKTPLSKEDNLQGFEIRKGEILQNLKLVKTPTLSIIAIQDKEYFKSKDKKVNVDPKAAIRCGFAETGRLTQFLTYKEFEREVKRIEESDEKYERKRQGAIKKGKKPLARNKNDKLNKVVEGSILDGFRQLGVIFDYEINKHLKGKKIVGLHVCNYKKTLYGSLPLFPIIVTYDVDNSKLMAYCELIDKVDIPYWKAILGLSKVAAARNIADLGRNISETTAYRRLDRIINDSDSEVVIIIDSDGTSRQVVKGIANSEIERAEKNEFNQIKRLLVNNDKYIDLTGYQRQLSIIRLRHNDEVPTYFTTEAGRENQYFLQASGIFKFNKIYYSIDQKAIHEGKAYDKDTSKANSAASFSHRNMLEIYPMFVSGDIINHEERETVAVGIVDMLRSASIQFALQKTILPLPLHLAKKMEEYI